MALRIIITGGTFDKQYDAIRGQLSFKNSHMPDIIERLRCTLPIKLESSQMVDSLDMSDENRREILATCRNALEELIVIIHGTDTMTKTAAVLAQALDGGDSELAGKRIILTGAMVPYSVSGSDALFNLGCAVMAVQLVDEGVFISMNGRCFPWNKVTKNRALGIFEGAAL